MTRDGKAPLLPSEEENCGIVVEVTEEEIKASVKIMPKLETLVSIWSESQSGSTRQSPSLETHWSVYMLETLVSI